MKQWNPQWKPKYFMTNYSEAELLAIEKCFATMKVFLCDFLSSVYGHPICKDTNDIPEESRKCDWTLCYRLTSVVSLGSFFREVIKSDCTAGGRIKKKCRSLYFRLLIVHSVLGTDPCRQSMYIYLAMPGNAKCMQWVSSYLNRLG